jgi:hypothetical protein
MAQGSRRDRLRLTTSYIFGGPNEIIIENTSLIPALITYWELVWVHRRFGRSIFERMEDYPDVGYCNIIVPAYSRYVMSVTDEMHLQSELDGHSVALYLKIYLAGRKRPLWLRVWKK